MKSSRIDRTALAVILILSVADGVFAGPEVPVEGQRYATIQEAIDAHPGRMIYVPPGDYEITKTIVIDKDGGGLFGSGRIIQTSPDQSIITVRQARNVRLSDLTLTRPAGKMVSSKVGVEVLGGENVTLSGLQLIDNQSQAGGIVLRDSVNCQLMGCLVLNYTAIAIDDRTTGHNLGDWGFAFKCIDGTGIVVSRSTGTMLQGNRVIEKTNLPTPEIKEKHGLGKFTKRDAQKGVLVRQQMWDEQYYNAWHQGSAIIVGAGCDYSQLLGNYIENAAQGMDIHSDHVIISGNIVNNSFIGMKAMHGSRNVMIIGNQFSKNDLWAIGLMPGAGSHPAGYKEADKPPMDANVDAGHIVANNIISDFGYGHANWAWSDTSMGRYPIRLDQGQKPMNLPLRDVVVTGNVVYDTGRDQVLQNGVPKVEPPRYKYAVFVNPGEDGARGRIAGPVDIHFSNNVFHAGTDGISNVELKP